MTSGQRSDTSCPLRVRLLRELFEELFLPLQDLIAGQIFFARRDRPAIAVRIADAAAAVAPELIAHLHLDLRAGGDRAVEQRVAGRDVEPQCGGRAAARLRPL